MPETNSGTIHISPVLHIPKSVLPSEARNLAILSLGSETALQHDYSCDGVREIGSKEDGVQLSEC